MYRLPIAGVVSILHRVSGAADVPAAALHRSGCSTPASAPRPAFERFVAAFAAGIGFVPVLVKLVCLALIWAYLHHAIAGIRHLWMDVAHSVSRQGPLVGHRRHG